MKTVHVSHKFAEEVTVMKESFLYRLMNEENLHAFENAISDLLVQYGIRFTTVKIEPEFHVGGINVRVYENDKELKFYAGYIEYVNEQMKKFRGTQQQREAHYEWLMNSLTDDEFKLDI